jgi:hypothetical protein
VAFLADHLQLFECIDGFGIMASSSPDCVQPALSVAVPRLLETAGRDVDDSSLDIDGDEFGFQSVVSASAAALRVVCQLCSLFPEVAAEALPAIAPLLDQYKDAPSGDGTMACARALSYLSGAGIDDDLTSIAVNLIKSSGDVETAGSAFEALARIASISDGVLDCLVMALRGELFFQRGICQIVPSLRRGLESFLGSLIESPRFESVRQTIYPLMAGFLAEESPLRRLAVHFFSRCIRQFPGAFDSDFMTAIVSHAIEDRALESLTLLVNTVPSFVLPRFQDLIAICEQISSEANIEEIEQCVLLLWTLVSQEQVIPHPLLELSCRCTPPRVLLSETSSFLKFILFLLNQQDQTVVIAALASLLRLHSEPQSLFRRRAIPPELSSQTKTMMRDLLARLDNPASFCAEVLESDQFRLQTLENVLNR